MWWDVDVDEGLSRSSRVANRIQRKTRFTNSNTRITFIGELERAGRAIGIIDFYVSVT